MFSGVPELYAYCYSAYSHPSTLAHISSRMRKVLNRVTTRPIIVLIQRLLSSLSSEPSSWLSG